MLHAKPVISRSLEKQMGTDAVWLHNCRANIAFCWTSVHSHMKSKKKQHNSKPPNENVQVAKAHPKQQEIQTFYMEQKQDNDNP